MANDDTAQRRQALNVRQNVIVKAPAGSGKTELLVQRALSCLSVAKKPEEVVCVTFTVKAANEIRQRIHDALVSAGIKAPDAEHERHTWSLAREVLARDEAQGWGLVNNPSRLRATTIDALNAALASRLPLLSGMGGVARIEESPSLLYRQAVLQVFEDYEGADLDAETADALERVLSFGENNIERLEPLLSSMLAKREQWMDILGATVVGDDSVRHAIDDHVNHVLESLISDRLTSANALVPSACADRLAGLVASASHRDRLSWASGMNGWPGCSVDDLAIWKSLADLLLTKQGAWRKSITAAQGFPAKEDDHAEVNEVLADLQAVEGLREALACLMDLPAAPYPENAAELRHAFAVVLGRCVAHLWVVFAGEAKIDFAELAMRAVTALGSDDGSTDVLEQQDLATSHLLVDEFQDTSTTQLKLIGLLTSGWEPGDGRSLFFVGDPQQSIYGFRQAEVREFLRIWEAGSFNQLELECLTLTRNFRSRPALVDACNEILGPGFPARGDVEGGVVPFTASAAVREDSDDTGVTVSGVDMDDERAEAEEAVDFVASALSRYPDRSVAVLGRAKKHVREVLRVLRERNIPFASQDLDALSASPSATDMIALIRALWHDADRGAWVGVLRAPFVGLSHADMVRLCENALSTPLPSRLYDDDVVSNLSDEGRARVMRLRRVLDACLADEDTAMYHDRLCESVWEALDGSRCVDAAGRRDVGRVLDVLRAECEGGQITALERFLARVGNLYADTNHGLVQVMTVHKAKGLEFDSVVLVGAGRSSGFADQPLVHSISTRHGYLLAPKPARSASDDAPERSLYSFASTLEQASRRNELMRLLYVAATRARERLHICCNLSGGRPKKESFADAVWASLEPRIDPGSMAGVGVSAAGEDDDRRYVPKVPCVSANHAIVMPEHGIRPQERRADLPSEHGVKETSDKVRSLETDMRARLVGEAYHRLMEAACRTPVPQQCEVEKKTAAIESFLRRSGLPEPAVGEAAATAVSLASRTLRCEEAAWFLSPGARRFPEYRYSGFVDGRWVSGVIDLVIEIGDEELWVIDYKVVSTGVLAGRHESFKAGLVRQYRGQVAEYVKALQRQNPGKTVRGGIYAPEPGMFVATTGEATEPA